MLYECVYLCRFCICVVDDLMQISNINWMHQTGRVESIARRLQQPISVANHTVDGHI